MTILQRLIQRFRRAAAEARLFWADVEVHSLCEQIRDASTSQERFALTRRLVAERAKQALARSAYQATLPPGERRTWIDA